MNKKTLFRKECDALGDIDVPEKSLWGIHTQRALDNFPPSGRRVPPSLIVALVTVKRAVAMTNRELGYLPSGIADAIVSACDKVLDFSSEDLERHFPVDGLQGGAGTSTNMNVNEVLANLALETMGKSYGEYETVHPIHHVNLHGSTNDLYPTALRVAAISGVRRLSESSAKLQNAFQQRETEFAAILKMGRTELQPAVPMTLGQEFSAFAEAVARDRWRTFKCEERLRLVNIGGTAIGTGMTAPRDYIYRVIEILRSITGMGLSRNENVVDGTANADAFVEVSGILKASAATLSKIAGDLRLLHFFGEIYLPPLQAGSSIMPGKVNPVMMEYAMQTALVVRANDMIVTESAAHGTLQINEFMPLIALALLESIDILSEASLAFADHVTGIKANPEKCRTFVDNSPTLLTAFLPHISYEEASALIREYGKEQEKNERISLRCFLEQKLGKEAVDRMLSPSSVTRLGFVNEKG